MYCKNCGEEIAPEAKVCMKCGYANGTGHNYCAHCKAKISKGQYLCVSCGYIISENESPVIEKSSPSPSGEVSYAEYAPQLMQLMPAFKFKLWGGILSLLCALLLIFCPLITCEKEAALKEIEDWEMLEDVLKSDGKITKHSSLFQSVYDSVSMLIEFDIEEIEKEFDDVNPFIIAGSIALLLAAIMLGCIFIANTIPLITDAARAMNNPSLGSKLFFKRAQQSAHILLSQERQLTFLITFAIIVFTSLRLLYFSTYTGVSWGFLISIAGIVGVGILQFQKIKIYNKIINEIH